MFLECLGERTKFHARWNSRSAPFAHRAISGGRKGGTKGARPPPIFGATKTSVFSTNAQIVLDRVLEYMIACNLPYVNVTSNSTTDRLILIFIHIT